MLDVKSKKYKEYTGIGCDAFRPRWFAWLSDELLPAFALFLNSLERLGVWPSQLSAILIAFITKSSGGTQPIGLLAAVVRLWKRVREPIVAEWRRSVERTYNWAAKGKSPQAAVWRLALRTEAARARGQESAAALVDLAKAFEYVRLELVWQAGLPAWHWKHLHS